MSEFIVLGLIPGTQMQITFLVWLVVAVGLAAYIVGCIGYRTQVFQAWLIATSIIAQVQRQDLRS